MAELDAAGVALYSDQQAIDSTTPYGKAMIQMAMNRVRQIPGKRLGRPPVGRKVEEAIRQQLAAGHGILKTSRITKTGSGTVQRVRKQMMAALPS